METFTRTINGNEYFFICRYHRTRIAFAHSATVYKNHFYIRSERVNYLNRTWESFTYQTVIKNAVWMMIQEVTNNLKTRFKNVHGYKVLTAIRREAFETWKNEQQEYKEVHALLESFKD